MFGLITKSRHEREMRELKAQHRDQSDALLKERAAIALQRDAFEAKFKKAITDLEKQDRENEQLRNNRDDWRETAKLYRPGHEANERRLKRDREQKAAKRAAKAPVKGAGK